MISCACIVTLWQVFSCMQYECKECCGVFIESCIVLYCYHVDVLLISCFRIVLIIAFTCCIYTHAYPVHNNPYMYESESCMLIVVKTVQMPFQGGVVIMPMSLLFV